MRITIYKSEHNWNDTIAFFNPQPYTNETEIKDKTYYSLKEIKIKNSENDYKVKIQPLLKKKKIKKKTGRT